MHMLKSRLVATLLLALGTAAGTVARAQDAPTPQQQQTAAQAEEDKQKAEKQAYALLEEVITDAQSLRLPENRGRMQVAAADLLWARDEGRARSLFMTTAASIAEAQRQTQTDTGDRAAFVQARAAMQLRQELVLTAARHDPALAYQLFQMTRRPQTSADAQQQGNRIRMDDDSILEQRLLAMVAAADPALAIRKAEELLDKGQYTPTLAGMLTQLQAKDKTAAARLSDKLISRLQPEALLASRDADYLAFSLLQPGPRPADTQAADAKSPASADARGALGEAAYRSLLDSVITTALKATPNATGGQGGGVRGGRGANNARGGVVIGQAGAQPQQQTDAQVEQRNARQVLGLLQTLTPQVDQYAPTRAQAVRQKLTELGIDSNNNNPRAAFTQFGALMQQGTADSLLTAATAAPPQLQPRLYQQAALRALDEGSVERARQIANEHLDADARGVVIQAIDARQAVRKAKASQLEEVRQTLARLPSDEERVALLLQLADSARTDDQKLALQFLEEARNLVTRRATNYQQFESQLQVAHAYATVDPARSFEVLELGINQLNELLPAAALLSGFEVNIFKDGEMSLPGNSTLGTMVARYGQELAVLAKSDFERARATADHFQYPEARLLARLAITQGVLGGRTSFPTNNRFNRRGFAQGAPVVVRQQ